MPDRNRQDWGENLIVGWSYYASKGNEPYHQTSFQSEPIKGDGLLHRASGQHTLQIHSIDFNGNIQILATLDRTISSTTDWIPVPITRNVDGKVFYPYVNYDFISPIFHDTFRAKTLNINDFFTISGQYAWLKAYGYDIIEGTVELIKLGF